MEDSTSSKDTQKEPKAETTPTTELVTKWLTDSVDAEHRKTVLNEDKKKE